MTFDFFLQTNAVLLSAVGETSLGVGGGDIVTPIGAMVRHAAQCCEQGFYNAQFLNPHLPESYKSTSLVSFSGKSRKMLTQ